MFSRSCLLGEQSSPTQKLRFFRFLRLLHFLPFRCRLASLRRVCNWPLFPWLASNLSTPHLGSQPARGQQYEPHRRRDVTPQPATLRLPRSFISFSWNCPLPVSAFSSLPLVPRSTSDQGDPDFPSSFALHLLYARDTGLPRHDRTWPSEKITSPTEPRSGPEPHHRSIAAALTFGLLVTDTIGEVRTVARAIRPPVTAVPLRRLRFRIA